MALQDAAWTAKTALQAFMSRDEYSFSSNVTTLIQQLEYSSQVYGLALALKDSDRNITTDRMLLLLCLAIIASS